jgi:hypothetical protein
VRLFAAHHWRALQSLHHGTSVLFVTIYSYACITLIHHHIICSGRRISAGATAQTQSYEMQGKAVVVTGANSGMGASTAAALLNRGAHVIAISRDEAATIRVLERFGTRVSGSDAKPRSFACVTADLLSFDSVRKAAASIAEQYGAKSLDVLVLNAGVMAPPFSRTVCTYIYIYICTPHAHTHTSWIPMK